MDPRLRGGDSLKANPLLAAARVLDVVRADFAASGDLGVAEGGLDRAAHLARRHLSQALERRARQRFRELPAPVVAAADLAVDRLGYARRAFGVGAVDLVHGEAVE